MNEKLRHVCKRLDEWCTGNSLDYDIVCDENDLQGVMLFKRDRNRVTDLLKHLRPTLQREGVHVRTHRTRPGTVLAFSLRSLSEMELETLCTPTNGGLGKKLHSLFREQDTPPQQPAVEIDPVQALMDSAQQLREEQRRPPTRANSRAQLTNRFAPTKIAPTLPGQEDEEESESSTLPSRKQRARFAGRLHHPSPHRAMAAEHLARRLDSVFSELNENPQPLAPPGGSDGLQGMGAEHQPDDLFRRFAAAMQQLGQQLKIGPLQDALKSHGIKWRRSDDGQALIFFVNNADTKAPQPIQRISSTTLGKPQEFQQQLLSMVDFAKGQAPGTEQQRYEEAQESQKAVRDIATAHAPPDPSKQQQQLPPATAQPPAPGAAQVPTAAPNPTGPGAGQTGPGPAQMKTGPGKPEPKPAAPKPGPKLR